MDKSFAVEALLKWKQDNKALTDASQKVQRIKYDLRVLREHAGRVLSQIGGFFDRGFAAAVRFGKQAMVVGGILVAAFAGGIVKISEAGAKLEGYQVTLQQLYGDAQEAGKAMQWIMGMQVRTPYTPEELLGGLKPLKVFGMDAQKWLPAIGDMASTMGKDLTETATAVSKAWSAGAGAADALRESFGATMTNLAKASGMTEAELKGDINKYREALWAFITDPKFAGGMKRYAATFKGALSSIKGGFQTFTMFLGREINNVMKQDFQKVVDWIVKMYESGKLEEWARRVAEGFKMIWQGLKKAGEVLWKFVKPLVDFFREHPHMLKWAISAVAAGGAFTLLGGGVSFISGKIGQMGMGLIRGIGQLKNFGGAIKNLIATTKAAGGIGNLIGAGQGGLVGKIGLLLGGGKGMAGGLLAGLGPVLGILAAVAGAVALFATAWKKNFGGIREAAQKAFAPLFGQGKGIKSLGEGIRMVFGKVREIWEKLAQILAPVFKIVIQLVGFVIRIGKSLAPIGQFVAKLQLGIVMGVLKAVFWLLEKIFKLLEPVLEGISWLFDQINYGFRMMTGEAQKDLEAVQAELAALQDKQTQGVKLTEDETKRLEELQAKYAELKKEVNRWPALTKFWTGVREKGKEAFDKVRENARFNFGMIQLLGTKLVDRLKENWEDFKNKASSAWDAIKNKGKETTDKIKSFFSGLWDKIKAPFIAVRDWLKTHIIDPVGNFFKNLFKPFTDAINKFFGDIANALSKLPTKILEGVGITQADIAMLRAKAKQTGPMGPPEPGTAGAEEFGAGGAGASPDEVAAAAAAAGGGAGGGGGPGINYFTTHNHYERGSVNIWGKDINVADFQRLLGTAVELEATG